MTSLAGKRILVTRPLAQAAELCDKLAALGAQPIVFPTIEIAPLEDYTALDRAIQEFERYHWAIFTSVNGVAAVWRRLKHVGKDERAFDGIQVAAIGPATARALGACGVRAEFIPEEYVAERILDGIGDVAGRRILLPRADIAREALAVELERRGAIVDEIAVYRTLPAALDPRGLAELQRGVDVVTFASSSTVRNFARLLSGQIDVLLEHVRVACIGPITAQTARELGLSVEIVANEYTMDGLVAALSHYFSRREEN